VSEIDKRNRLGEEPFDYQITKKGTVVIYYEGKQIKIVKDREAERLIVRINEVEDNIPAVHLNVVMRNLGKIKENNLLLIYEGK
jgi:hypothetical protein